MLLASSIRVVDTSIPVYFNEGLASRQKLNEPPAAQPTSNILFAFFRVGSRKNRSEQ